MQDHRTGAALPLFTVKVEKGRGVDARQIPAKQPGAFDLLGLRPGAVRVRVSAPGYAARAFSARLARPTRIGDPRGTRHTITLRQAGAIYGRITALTGRGVKGASVSAGGVTARTSAAGKFRLVGVPEGTHTVQVSVGGRTQRSDPVVVRADQASGPVRILMR